MVDIGSILGLAIEDVAKIDGYEIATGAKCMGLDISLGPSGDVGLLFGGVQTLRVIQFCNIASSGGASDFGDTIQDMWDQGCIGSSTRAIAGAGSNGGQTDYNNIEYVTFLTMGNATDFGDLTQDVSDIGTCSSSTRGIWAGGNINHPTHDETNIISYSTIASTGNATDFGDLVAAKNSGGSCASTTRGILNAGGYRTLGAVSFNSIDYVTIATTANAGDFGDLVTNLTQATTGCSNSTTGLIAGGYLHPSAVYTNVVQKITIATTGNSTDFGDLSSIDNSIAAFSNSTRAVWSGGSQTPTYEMRYSNFASGGTVTDFGTPLGYSGLGGCSNSHGGI
jgi:hypothetical protein